jgi:ABC-type uncharacterized transport system permease subunit
MRKIARYASLAILSLALADTVAQWNGYGFIFLFKEKQAAFSYLFSVGFFMAAGFAYLVRHAKSGLLFAALGVLFAVRAGLAVPEGGQLPWCTPTSPTKSLC